MTQRGGSCHVFAHGLFRAAEAAWPSAGAALNAGSLGQLAKGAGGLLMRYGPLRGGKALRGAKTLL
jgi:hypothetical protein